MILTHHLDIPALRSFVLAKSLGSFTAAAKSLNCSQAALSLRIKKLEESLQCTLFHRDYHRLSLTASGERLLPLAMKALKGHDDILEDFREARQKETIRLGIAEDLARPFFRDLIGRYAISNLNMQIDITMLLSRDLVVELEAGRLDLAIVSLPSEEATGQLLCKRASRWVCAEDFSLDPEAPVPLAVHPEKCVLRTDAIKQLENNGRDYRIVFSGNGSSGIQAAVLAGMGLTVMSEDTIPAELATAPASWNLPDLGDMDIRLLSANDPTPGIQAFRDALCATYHTASP